MCFFIYILYRKKIIISWLSRNSILPTSASFREKNMSPTFSLNSTEYFFFVIYISVTATSALADHPENTS